MDLHQEALTQGVKRKDSCKLFWGLYPYSLKIAVPDCLNEDRLEALHGFWKKANKVGWTKVQPPLRAIRAQHKERLQEYLNEIIRANSEHFNDDHYYLANEGSPFVTFYVKTKEAAAGLIRGNPGLFLEYHAPPCADAEETMREMLGKKVEVRRKLYHGEYDHRILFKWQTNFEDLDARVTNICFEDSLYVEGRINRLLYVKGDDDFFLAKLALQDRIKSVTMCVLVED
jgi:hypothetical protein